MFWFELCDVGECWLMMFVINMLVNYGCLGMFNFVNVS